MTLLTPSTKLVTLSDTFVDFKSPSTSPAENKSTNIRNFLAIYDVNNKELSSDIIVTKIENAYLPFQYTGKNGRVVWDLEYFYITKNDSNTYMVIGSFENSSATMRIDQIKREFPKIEGLELQIACFAKIQKFTFLIVDVLQENNMKLIGCPKYPS